MAKPDGRIEKGQPLNRAISARAWNRTQDAADLVLGASPGFEAESGGAFQSPYSRIMVHLVAGQDVVFPRWTPVFLNAGLHGYQPESTPTTDAQRNATSSFEQMPIIRVLNSGDGLVGVLLQPLKAGEIGWAAVGGIVQTKITNTGPNYFVQQAQYARPIAAAGNDPPKFVTDWFCGYRILWREHTRINEPAWALVDLSNHYIESLVLLKTIARSSKVSGQSTNSDLFRAVAHIGDFGFELPDPVAATNTLLDLEAGVFVWARHPASFNNANTGPESWPFQLVALQSLSEEFTANIVENLATPSNGRLTLISYPRV